MVSLRQIEPREVLIGETKFYIRPIPAFRAANITGELASVLAPILVGLAPILDHVDTDKESKDLFDIDITKEAPSIASAFEGLSGDKIEKLLRKLILQQGIVAVELKDYESGETEVVRMTEDIANEIFCTDLQDMFILCFEIIRMNYNGFFSKVGDQFGILKSVFQKESQPRKTY